MLVAGRGRRDGPAASAAVVVIATVGVGFMIAGAAAVTGAAAVAVITLVAFVASAFQRGVRQGRRGVHYRRTR